MGRIVAFAVLVVGLVAATGSASAHVVIAERGAEPGSYQVLTFLVGHGCRDGSATVRLEVEIPPEIRIARPQPKPGWSVSIARAPAGSDPHGGQVTAVEWRGGPLPDDQFDGFELLVHMPDRVGPIYLPATQTCETARSDWNEISSGIGTHLSHPAPMIILRRGEARSDGRE